jgi:hypothetical protein
LYAATQGGQRCHAARGRPTDISRLHRDNAALTPAIPFSLRWGRILCTGLLGVGFVGLMMPNRTASGSTDFTMARHVTSYPTDDCAVDASLRLGRVRKCESEQSRANDQVFHDGFLRG